MCMRIPNPSKYQPQILTYLLFPCHSSPPFLPRSYPVIHSIPTYQKPCNLTRLTFHYPINSTLCQTAPLLFPLHHLRTRPFPMLLPQYIVSDLKNYMWNIHKTENFISWYWSAASHYSTTMFFSFSHLEQVSLRIKWLALYSCSVTFRIPFDRNSSFLMGGGWGTANYNTCMSFWLLDEFHMSSLEMSASSSSF